MLSTDQLSSSLIFLFLSSALISFLFSDSTIGKEKKVKLVYLSITIVVVLCAIKIFSDTTHISPNYYNVLQIPRHANTLDIRRAYKQLSKEHHPDKNLSNEESNVLFQQVKIAYDILMDENYRDIYNRFGLLSSFDFDPRKDDLKLLTDLSLTYIFWAVVSFIVTFPVSARACRTWIAILGVGALTIESTVLLSETIIPEGLDFLPSQLIEFEVIYYMHSLFPVAVVLLRVLAEYLYVDVDMTSINVLTNVTAYQKDLDSLLQQLQSLIEVSAVDSEDDKEERVTKIATLGSKINHIRTQLEDSTTQTLASISQLKQSSSNPGANYYWILLVVMYGGAYFLN